MEQPGPSYNPSFLSSTSLHLSSPLGDLKMSATGRAAVTTLLFLLLLLHLPASYSADFEVETHTYASFNDSDRETLAVLYNATIAQDALQLTPDTGNEANIFLVNATGRVLLNQPFKLWEPQKQLPLNTTNTTTNSSYTIARNRVASFNTSFTINVFRFNGTIPGEGLAFILAPSLDPPPPGSTGGYLGLTDEANDGQPSNHLVAIEFDTFKQYYDVDSNHVGLDINSVRSNVSEPLTPLGIEISPVGTAFYAVWIQYDGVARHIWVYMALEGQPPRAVLNASLDLSDYLLQESYFGFAGSTGTNYELNCVRSWNLSVEVLPRDHGMATWKLTLAIGLPLAAVILVLALGIILKISYIRRRRMVGDPSLLMGKLKSLPGMPREFKFKDLKKATNNFDEKNKLGQGGFGMVYKGVLPGENTEVAVKKFSRDNSKQGDFLAELSIINRLRHKHLVRLVGWCHNNGVLLLVYDFMPNGSLDQHLFGGPDRLLLSWDRRYNILVGVASALHYLHNEYDQKVVHRDLKGSNIMLDAAFNARLGDFGLARALETDKTSYAELELGGVPGTPGYIAPECFHTGKFTRESDIFGFGAVVLEVVCGRRPRCDIAGFQFLADWVWKLHSEDRILKAVDPRLGDAYSADQARRLLLLGLACNHPTPGDRPKMEAIVQIVSGSMQPPVVPPFRPAFMWPSFRPDDDEEGGGTTSSTSRVTNAAVTSSYYTTSFASRQANVGGSDISVV